MPSAHPVAHVVPPAANAGGPLPAPVAVDALAAAGWPPTGPACRMSANAVRVTTDVGDVVVKGHPEEPGRADRVRWQVDALDELERRGCGVPTRLWWGRHSGRWLTAHLLAPGRPMDPATVDVASVVDHVTRQQAAPARLRAAYPNQPGWWEQAVLFDGHRGWVDIARAVAPDTVDRAVAAARTACPAASPCDIVRYDTNPGNWLVADDGTVVSMIDFDHMGLGTAAIDLADAVVWLQSSPTPPDRDEVARAVRPAAAAFGGWWPVAVAYVTVSQLVHRPADAHDRVLAAATTAATWR